MVTDTQNEIASGFRFYHKGFRHVEGDWTPISWATLDVCSGVFINEVAPCKSYRFVPDDLIHEAMLEQVMFDTDDGLIINCSTTECIE